MAKKNNFEQSLEQLEKIVSELESGDMTLEEAIKKFEEGMTLSKTCSQILDETEKKVLMLIKEHDDHILEKPFTENES